MRRTVCGIAFGALLAAAACEKTEHPQFTKLEQRPFRAEERAKRALLGPASDASITGGSAGQGLGTVTPPQPDAPPAAPSSLLPSDGAAPPSPTSTAAPPLDAAQKSDSGAAPIALEPIGDLGRYVVLVSFDGLAPRFLERLIEEKRLPTLAAFRSRAAWTHEARTSPGSSVTLPNHFSMITSRPTSDDEQFSPGGGHQLVTNSTLPNGETVHSYSADSYIPSAFDVVHDHGGRTGLFASKVKFRAFADGYGPEHGAPDPYPKDYGKSKIDVVSVNDGSNAAAVVTAFIDEAARAPINFSFVHLRDTDSAGHSFGWGTPEYMEAMMSMDRAFQRLLSFVDEMAPYKANTHVIVTTDHGGDGFGHSDHTNALNFRIPLYVAGPTISQGGDLYDLAGALRAKPPGAQYALPNTAPPLRNGDAGNLATTLLGLPEIPNSTMRSFHAHGRWPFQSQSPETPR